MTGLSDSELLDGDPRTTSIIRVALVRLHLDTLDQGHALGAFHRWNPPSTKVMVLQSPDFLKELHLCWRDTSALTKWMSAP